MARVSANPTEEVPFDDDVEAAFADDEADDRGDPEEPRQRRTRRTRRSNVDVEIEREVTKRAIIESVTRLLVVLLYMAFTLIREREAGVVALDPEDDDLGPEDDWAE